MDFESQDYFQYKKNRARKNGAELPKNQPSKFGILMQIFAITFIIFFIVIVFFIMKFSSKVDIEYPNGDIPNSTTEQEEYDETETQGRIDKRLSLIQQEENAPSEAKIVKLNDQNNEVISQSLFEESRKQEKAEKIKKSNAKDIAQKELLNQKEDTSKAIVSKLSEKLPLLDKKNVSETSQENVKEQNQTITSKVLIGRFSSFDDAKNYQGVIKQKDPSLSPFVRKIGEAYSLQMGSYNDFAVAKSQAQKLKALGYDTWIYQQ